MATISLNSSMATLNIAAKSTALCPERLVTKSAQSSFFGSKVAPLRLKIVNKSLNSRRFCLTRATLATEVEMPKYPPFAAFKIHGTGRRKTAVARVGLIEGNGAVYVNGLPLSDYFQGQQLLIQAVKLPVTSLGLEGKYDFVIKAHGGGLSAQSQAMVLGIARALVESNAANKPPLKAQGMLTRDSRAVERKKYGLKKARKASQFSKR